MENNQNIILQIPPEYCFDCPEGNFKSILHEVRYHEKLTRDGPQILIRMIFCPDLARFENKVIVAAKNFIPSIEPHSQLRIQLEQWLGKEFFDRRQGVKIDLKSLEGRAADIKTIHIRKESYRKAFVTIQGIYPPGTLTLAENPSGNLKQGVFV